MLLKRMTYDQGNQIEAVLKRALEIEEITEGEANCLIAQKDAFQAALTRLVFDFTAPSLALANELIPRDWEVVADVVPRQLNVADLQPRSYHKPDDVEISGDEMLRRLTGSGGLSLGLVDGKRILAEQDKIPVKWRNSGFILPGTVLKSLTDRLFITVLIFGSYEGFDKARWHHEFWPLNETNWIGRPLIQSPSLGPVLLGELLSSSLSL